MDVTSISLASFITVMGAILAYVGYTRSKMKDDQQRAEEGAIMKADISSLKKDLDEVKRDIRLKDDKIEAKMEKIYEKLEAMNEHLIDFIKERKK